MMDEFAKMIAGLDQLGEQIKLVAPVVKIYFDALVTEGFSKEEALALTMAWQTALFTQRP